MGLDITAVSKIALYKTDNEIRKLSEDDLDALYDGNYARLWSNQYFLDREDGLEPGFYSFAEEMGFRAGSYSGYNRWRDWLARTFMGHPAEEIWLNPNYAGRPFFELVHMSDCEGFIGPKTSAKLAKNFKDNAHRLDDLEGDTFDLEYNVEKYRTWQEALALAADGGAILFH